MAELDKAIALPLRVLVHQPVGPVLGHVFGMEVVGTIVLGLADRQIRDDQTPRAVRLLFQLLHFAGAELTAADVPRGGIRDQQIEGRFGGLLHPHAVELIAPAAGRVDPFQALGLGGLGGLGIGVEAGLGRRPGIGPDDRRRLHRAHGGAWLRRLGGRGRGNFIGTCRQRRRARQHRGQQARRRHQPNADLQFGQPLTPGRHDPRNSPPG